MQDVSNTENSGKEWLWEYSILSSQFFCRPETILKKEKKKKVYYSKKKKKGNRNWKNNLIKGTIIF